MTDMTPPSAPPGPLLLATDLDARCDRAMDRAAQLATEWGTGLVALHVLDAAASADRMLAWADGEDDGPWLAQACRRLERELRHLPARAAARVIPAADVAGTIRREARDADVGLVVTGVSRGNGTGRWLLGSTVERLARTLVQPLLVVRERVRGPYARIVVATDFSDASGHALRTAARLFPGRESVPFHAFGLPLSSQAGDDRAAAIARGIERGECARFLAAHAPPTPVPPRPVIVQGPVETALAAHVRSHDTDLVVVATQGRGAIADALLGSTAISLLDWLPCDTLLVRAPGAQG